MRIILTTILMIVPAFVHQAQTLPKESKVEWQALSGVKKEFSIYFPAGSRSVEDSGKYLGPKRSLHKIVYRHINGVLLMMEYYEGDAEALQKHLIYREKLTDVAAETFGDFTIKHFSQIKNTQAVKIDHFLLKDRMYVVKAFSAEENDPISVAFLRSVRLTAASGIFTPNDPAGSKETKFQSLTEKTFPIDDSQIFSSKDVDREAITLYAPKVSSGRGLGDGSVKLRLFLSATGKVTDVTVISSSNKSLERPTVEAAKQTLFIPAQKNGQLVATYKENNYMFVSVRN
ncbi:MAG: energy transducer TonB [Pyrinomonadaceae bacterium]